MASIAVFQFAAACYTGPEGIYQAVDKKGQEFDEDSNTGSKLGVAV